MGRGPGKGGHSDSPRPLWATVYDYVATWTADGRSGPRPFAVDRDVAVVRRAGPGVRVYPLDGSVPDCWRYVAEVQDAGKPADAMVYR